MIADALAAGVFLGTQAGLIERASIAMAGPVTAPAARNPATKRVTSLTEEPGKRSLLISIFSAVRLAHAAQPHRVAEPGRSAYCSIYGQKPGGSRFKGCKWCEWPGARGTI